MDEPWFEDARVKTAVTILQRCEDEIKRDGTLVRFVRLKRPLSEILGQREDEEQRQKAAERLRDLILKAKTDLSNDQLRIMVKRQADLWLEGLSVAKMFARQKALAAQELASDDDEDGDDNANNGRGTQIEFQAEEALSTSYGGGKWGRYLRAPDFYFEIMREFGHRFTRLGEVATIKRGITSGCDGFFMPRNVSKDLLEKNESEVEWQTLPLMRRCKRADVESGKLVIVKCGDNTLHPIESEFVRPEVHSLMQVDRPMVSPDQLDRVVLWVNQPLRELKGTYAHHYITWGSKQTFASNKSKPVPIPERPTCATRPLWYLALDAWNELEPEWQKPLAAWLEEQTGNAKTVNLPDGDVRLPDAGNFFEATTIYFGKKPAISHVCASRSEAELLFTIARAGLRGPVSLPTNEKQCGELIKLIEARLVIGREKLEQLAQQRAGTDKLREQILETLYRWFIQGKPE